MNKKDENNANNVVLTEKIFIDKIFAPTDNWSIFNTIFDILQKECIEASQKIINIYNIYVSYMINFDECTAKNFIKENYNKNSVSSAADMISFDKETNLCYSRIIGNLVQNINKNYFGDHGEDGKFIREIKSGEGNPPMTFTKSLPIPIAKDSCDKIKYNYLERSSNKNSRYYVFEFPFFCLHGRYWYNERYEVKLKNGHIKFGVNAKNDHTYKILENILCGNYQLCDSKLKRIEARKNAKDENGKHKKYEYIFLLSYKRPKKEAKEDNSNRIMGVDLGIKVPACCGANFDDYHRKSLGGDKIIQENIKQEKINKKLQQEITYNCRDGHGRTTKLDGYDGKGHKIKNRNETFNHMLSKRIVDTAIKWDCGVIQLEDLSGIKNCTDNKFLKNWTYYDLQQKIKYKAEMNGIKVQKINPYHTSQTCSFCGHFEKGQRLTQSQFICKNPECKNYNKPINADWNASRNIAMSTDYRAWEKSKNKSKKDIAENK